MAREYVLKCDRCGVIGAHNYNVAYPTQTAFVDKTRDLDLCNKCDRFALEHAIKMLNAAQGESLIEFIRQERETKFPQGPPLT